MCVSSSVQAAVQGLTSSLSFLDDFMQCLLSKQCLGFQPPITFFSSSYLLPPSCTLSLCGTELNSAPSLSLCSSLCSFEAPCSPCLVLFHSSPIPSSIGWLSRDISSTDFSSPLSSALSDKTLLLPCPPAEKQETAISACQIILRPLSAADCPRQAPWKRALLPVPELST